MKEIKITELTNYINPLLLEEEPAIALASNGKRVNGLTIGWASYGVLWNKLTATVYVHAKRYSKEIFDDASYFAICYLKDREVVKYFGSVSGRNEDKMKGSNIEVEYNDLAPYFKDSDVVVFGKIMGRSDFDLDHVDEGVYNWYARDGVHTCYYGEIIKVLVK